MNKQPRALMNKLGNVELKILDQLTRKDFICEWAASCSMLALTKLPAAKQNGTDSFWKQHCNTVPLHKLIFKVADKKVCAQYSLCSNSHSACTYRLGRLLSVLAVTQLCILDQLAPLTITNVIIALTVSSPNLWRTCQSFLNHLVYSQQACNSTHLYSLLQSRTSMRRLCLGRTHR